jgi:hypothetical protein
VYGEPLPESLAGWPEVIVFFVVIVVVGTAAGKDPSGKPKQGPRAVVIRQAAEDDER